MKENKKVNDKARTTKTPMTCDLEIKTKGDGKIKSVNVLFDPQNILNKNLIVIFLIFFYILLKLKKTKKLQAVYRKMIELMKRKKSRKR